MKIYLPTPERLCHCNAALIDPEALAALEEGFLRLRLADAATPLKKHLPRRVFALLQFRTSPMGASLLDVAQQGMLHHDAPVGAVLPDPSAYEPFQLLLDPLLDERHFGFDAEDCQPAVDWGDWSRLRSLDPRGKYILATAVSACRNLPGFRFTPTIVPDELHKVEDTLLLTLYKLPGVYKGKYEFINCMPPTRKKQLEQDHCLFTCGDKYDHAANVPRFWSYGRGVFVNKERNFFVWINSRDHMRVFSQEKNGDLQTAYRRLMDVMPVLDACLRPVRHDRLGFLTVNLDNLGSGLILSARMCLPNIPQSVIESITKVYHMETKHMEENIYLVSHNGHLGYTEFEVAREFNHGVREVLFMARFYDTKKRKKKRDKDGADKPDGPDKPDGSSPPAGGGGQGDAGKSNESGEQSETTTETVTETVTVVENDETGGGGADGPAPISAPPPQDFIWTRPSVVLMRASVSTTASRPSVHGVPHSDAKDASHEPTNLQTQSSETEMHPAHKISSRPRLTFYDDLFDNNEKRKIETPEEDRPKTHPPLEKPSSRFKRRASLPEDEYLRSSRHALRSRDGSEVEEEEEETRPGHSENITPQEKKSHEMVTTLSGVFQFEEKALSSGRSASTAENSVAASTAPKHIDSADLFNTGEYSSEEKSPRDASRHKLRRTSSSRLASASDLFYKGGRLPEERSPSTRTSATRLKTPSAQRVTQDSETAEMFYLGGVLPEERSRPVTSGSSTPQRQSSREKFSRLSGVFHVGRKKSKEGSLTNVKDADRGGPSTAATAPKHSDSAGRDLPEETIARDSSRHRLPRRTSSGRLASATDLFYKGGPLPEERSPSTRTSATRLKTPSAQRVTPESEAAQTSNIGGMLSEERTRPVTSGSATPQRQSSREKFSRLSGVFHVGRKKSKEGSLTNVKDADGGGPSTASTAPKHSDSTGRDLRDETARDSSKHRLPRRTSSGRLASATDLFYKGGPLPEERSPSTRTSATRLKTPSAQRVTPESEAAEMFYLGGVLPEERSRPVTSGSATPQRQSSREKLSRLSGVFHVGRKKSKEGSQTNVREADIGGPSTASTTPKHSDSTGKDLRDETARDSSRHRLPRRTSSGRLASATDLFYKGGPLPEERSPSTRTSATRLKTPSSQRVTPESEAAEMFYLGGVLPEERTRPVTSGSATPQRQSSREKFSRLSGVFHVGRKKSKEGSQTNVRDAGTGGTSTAAKHSDSRGRDLHEDTARDSSRHGLPRRTSSGRLASAADLFYKGGPLPEERSPSTRTSATRLKTPSAQRVTPESEAAEMFYLGGVLPEERSRPVTSGSATPQRQSSREKFSRLSGVFHVGRKKSKEGSQTNVRETGIAGPSTAPTAPKHSDSTGRDLRDETARDSSRHKLPRRTSSGRLASAADLFYKGGPLPEERSPSTRTSATRLKTPSAQRVTPDSEAQNVTPHQQSSREKLSRSSGVFIFRHKPKGASQTSVRDTGVIEPSAPTAPKRSDTPRHTTPEKQQSVDRFSSAADLFYKGGPLPEERSPSTRTSATRLKTPSAHGVTPDSEAAQKSNVGGVLPEERSRPVTTGSATPQRQSSREKFSRLSGVFHVGRKKSKEGSLSNVNDARAADPSAAASTAPKQSDSADLFYSGGFLPEEKSKRDASRHTSPQRPPSVDRFSSATDMFYKGGPLPEEKSLSTRQSATQIQKPTEHRDTQGKAPGPPPSVASKHRDADDLVDAGGTLPEEKSKRDASRHTSPQRPPSVDRFSSATDLFYKGGPLPEERPLSARQSASQIQKPTERRDTQGSSAEPPASIAPTHRGADDLVAAGGILSAEKSKREASRHTSPDRRPSVDRFSSATDLFQKGAPLPEERSLSARRSATQTQKPTEQRDTQRGKAAQTPIVGGVLPEEMTRPVTAGNVTPQRQRSREMFSRPSGTVHDGQNKSKQGSLSNVRDASAAKPHAPSTAPKRSDADDLVDVGRSIPEEKFKREASRRTSLQRPPSVDRFSSATDVIHKGAPLAEERPPSTRANAPRVHPPPARRDTQHTGGAEMPQGGVLPEGRTGSVHSGIAAPQRQASREKVSPFSAGFHGGRQKSTVGSLTSLRQDPATPSNAPTAPRSDATSFLNTGVLSPEDTLKRDTSNVPSNRGVLRETGARTNDDSGSGLNFNTFPVSRDLRNTPQRTIGTPAQSNENQSGIPSSSQLPNYIPVTRYTQGTGPRTVPLFPDNNVLNNEFDVNAYDPFNVQRSDPSRIQPMTSAIWPQRQPIAVTFADTAPSTLPGEVVDGARGQEATPETEERPSHTNVLPPASSSHETQSTRGKKN